jgi:hypothetical protein
MVSIDIKALLEFFDEKPESSRHHATAVCSVAGEELGVALLKRYLEGEGREVALLSGSCTTGKQKGPRLDRWLLVTEGRKHTLYQVEVKNWSAHAIGGRCLTIDATERDLSEYKIERWQHEWRNGHFAKRQVSKVLIPMRPPTVNHNSLEPLVCYWTALHPEGLDKPLFTVSVRGTTFSLVNVFSMSSYLRNLRKMGKRRLQLEMPETSIRMNWLHTLFRL